MLFKLDEQSQNLFAEAPEAGMDFHLGVSEDERLYFVIGCRIAINIHAWLEEGTAGAEERLETWLDSLQSGRDPQAAFDAWIENVIPLAVRITPVPPPPPGSPVIGTPGGSVAAAPVAATVPYGHLMFQSHTAARDVFYRWEAFPTSRRIIPTKRTIAANTFASPASEVPFMPTGFAAVGRCALPNPFPSCFRWELQPVAGTLIRCGASVPLFGQSGGGVEVMFPGGAPPAAIAMRGPIANPVRIPPL